MPQERPVSITAWSACPCCLLHSLSTYAVFDQVRWRQALLIYTLCTAIPCISLNRSVQSWLCRNRWLSYKKGVDLCYIEGFFRSVHIIAQNITIVTLTSRKKMRHDIWNLRVKRYSRSHCSGWRIWRGSISRISSKLARVMSCSSTCFLTTTNPPTFSCPQKPTKPIFFSTTAHGRLRWTTNPTWQPVLSIQN